jgi:hypothetical protein
MTIVEVLVLRDIRVQDKQELQRLWICRIQWVAGVDTLVHPEPTALLEQPPLPIVQVDLSIHLLDKAIVKRVQLARSAQQDQSFLVSVRYTPTVRREWSTLCFVPMGPMVLIATCLVLVNVLLARPELFVWMAPLLAIVRMDIFVKGGLGHHTLTVA